MTNIADLDVHQQAFVTLLRAHPELADTRIPGDASEAEHQQLQPPYILVWDTGGGGVSGPVADPHDDYDGEYQVTVVASGQRQANWLLTRAREALLIPVSGWTIAGRQLMEAPSLTLNIGLRRDPDVSPNWWTGMDRYRIRTSPNLTEGS